MESAEKVRSGPTLTADHAIADAAHDRCTQASELHEKRTGKSLQVTREAVEREENYPETEKGQKKQVSTGQAKQRRGQKTGGRSGPTKEGAMVNIAQGEEDLGEEDEGALFEEQDYEEGEEGRGDMVSAPYRFMRLILTNPLNLATRDRTSRKPERSSRIWSERRDHDDP